MRSKACKLLVSMKYENPNKAHIIMNILSATTKIQVYGICLTLKLQKLDLIKHE